MTDRYPNLLTQLLWDDPGDGVALISAAHPPDPWPWYRYLSGIEDQVNGWDPFAFETMTIEVKEAGDPLFHGA